MPTVRIGLIGKTNTGKTTFFNSATSQTAEISNYPFTTKTPNAAIGHAAALCVHKELGLKVDNPRGSACIDGWRMVPIEIIDLPGLVRGAAEGRGLGNQFLTVAAQSDVLLHIVDASGSIDVDGKISNPGAGDPVADIADIEEELALWYLMLFENSFEKIVRTMKSKPTPDFAQTVTDQLLGVGVRREHVATVLQRINLFDENVENWSEDQKREFAWSLREESKPTLIVANKMDVPESTKNFHKIRDAYRDRIIVPCSAESELTLRRAEQSGVIKYFPGEERFDIVKGAKLTEKQSWALAHINEAILGEYLRTGVQFAINVAVFKLLRMNAVYPVSDPARYSDRSGNILPDVFLMSSGSTVADLAQSIHTDLAKGLIYAVDARTGLRLPADYQLKDRDVLSIVSAMKKVEARKVQ
ncbi:MAG: YchF-related putative GTPase [Thaumarchaeota archaeon]|nr:YchF-related putative GTPase [Nitrososphaerota archaeon]MCL5068653.1 YchF-related putative GTPase [Nitrososphaerota archaeon]MDG6907855.1 redox-regulated ATPase YchF [Nitrososphaerota archaeon]